MTEAKKAPKTAKKSVPAKAVADNGGTVTISLVKGLARTKPNHRATVRSLGLTRVGQTVTQPDNPAIRGMITAVGYLLRVE